MSIEEIIYKVFRYHVILFVNNSEFLVIKILIVFHSLTYKPKKLLRRNKPQSIYHKVNCKELSIDVVFLLLVANNKLTEYGINIQSHNKSNERKIMSWKRIKLNNRNNIASDDFEFLLMDTHPYVSHIL